jgi:hypothetical protein
MCESLQEVDVGADVSLRTWTLCRGEVVGNTNTSSSSILSPSANTSTYGHLHLSL